jgi:hypothetical protein
VKAFHEAGIRAGAGRHTGKGDAENIRKKNGFL